MAVVTFQNVKILFREQDRDCMLGQFDLYKYEDVKNNVKPIWNALSYTDPNIKMPPDGKWIQKNLDTFQTWMENGMPEGIPMAPEREAFYKLLNIEMYPEFLVTAKDMAYNYLENAKAAIKKYSENPSPDDEFDNLFLKSFKYTQDAFDKRLEDIYNYCEKEAETYQPANDPNYGSRDDVIERVRQFAPFNQTDGAWLRNAVKVGPIDEISALLFEIWQDELGNGKVELNHSTLYTTLLEECGIRLPNVYQDAYAFDPNFLDSAFSAPTLALCVSQFSSLFFPEILGFTLLIEWTVLEIKPTIKLFKYYGVDPHFYVMHVAIDNASTGHGAHAKRAIELYLDYVSQSGGDDAVQEAWERIWTGYVAFWATGTLGDDLSKKIRLKRLGIPTLSERMVDMISYKAPYAKRNHDDRKLGDKLINDWFEDPKGFLNALAESSYIVKGDPDESPILSRVTTWDGPMYKVFTDDELGLWRDWISSLDPNLPPPNLNLDLFAEMKRLIETLKNNQYDEQAHAMHTLTGPDPDNPSNPDAYVTNDIHWWLNHDDPVWMMKALICDKNDFKMVIPGKPESSPFITTLMSPANKMGTVFANVAIRYGPIKTPVDDLVDEIKQYQGEIYEPWTWADIVYQWIKSGCPIKESSENRLLSISKTDLPVTALYTHHSGFIKHRKYGPGGIH